MPELTNTYGLPVERLIGGLQKAYNEAARPDDTVLFALVASCGEALVATSKRLLILKAGFAAGGADAFKAKAFPYENIMKVDVKAGMVQGMLQVQAPGVKPVAAGAADAYKAENVVTFIGADHQEKFTKAGKALNDMATKSH